MERAMDLAEPDGTLLWFLLHPVPDLLERQARQRTAHAALIAEILSLLAGDRPAPPSAGLPQRHHGDTLRGTGRVPRRNRRRARTPRHPHGRR
jgi:hypothetical protein